MTSKATLGVIPNSDCKKTPNMHKLTFFRAATDFLRAEIEIL